MKRLIMVLTLAALMVTIPMSACNPVTPGIKTGTAYVANGYNDYVKIDPNLEDYQRAEKLEASCNLMRLVGVNVPEYCPPVGGEE